MPEFYKCNNNKENLLTLLGLFTGSINHDISYSGVSPTNSGVLMVAILLNVVLLQLFGCAIIGEYSLPCFPYHSTKFSLKGKVQSKSNQK